MNIIVRGQSNPIRDLVVKSDDPSCFPLGSPNTNQFVSVVSCSSARKINLVNDIQNALTMQRLGEYKSIAPHSYNLLQLNCTRRAISAWDTQVAITGSLDWQADNWQCRRCRVVQCSIYSNSAIGVAEEEG